MKLYIAASSHPDERKRIDHAFALMQAQSAITVVGDWRASVDAHGGNPSDRGVARDAANDDVESVQSADVLWFLVPSDGGRGCWWEFGFAVGLATPVVCSGVPETSIFTTQAMAAFSKDEDAARYILSELAAFGAKGSEAAK